MLVSSSYMSYSAVVYYLAVRIVQAVVVPASSGQPRRHFRFRSASTWRHSREVGGNGWRHKSRDSVASRTSLSTCEPAWMYRQLSRSVGFYRESACES